MKSILLTFDLEEFDLPREQKVHIGEEEMYKTSIQGLTNLLFILNKHNIQATFFTTANFANKYPETLKQLSKNHEIASHGYSHSEPITPSNIKKAKEIKEEIINKKIKGFRAPRWNITDLRNINMPNHIKKPSGKQLTRKLDCYIRFCKKNNYKFQTCEQFLKKHLIKQYLKPINYAI
jgi:peptidoglycan/xylan/chitin deacetylase (PgdA/CDA1 family)